MWPFKTMSKRQSLHMQAMNAELTNRILFTIAQSLEKHVQLQQDIYEKNKVAIELATQKQAGPNDLMEKFLPMAAKMLEDATGTKLNGDAAEG